MVMVLGVWFDDPLKYTNYGDDTITDDRTLFRQLHSWGSEIRLYSNDNQAYTSTQESADEYYYMIDI